MSHDSTRAQAEFRIRAWQLEQEQQRAAEETFKKQAAETTASKAKAALETTQTEEKPAIPVNKVGHGLFKFGRR